MISIPEPTKVEDFIEMISKYKGYYISFLGATDIALHEDTENKTILIDETEFLEELESDI